MEVVYIIFGFIIALFVFYAIRTLIFMRFGPKAKGSKLTKVLGRFCRIRSYRVLQNVKLRYRGQIVTIDNIVIGFFGLIVFTDMKEIGEYYGDAKDEQWVQSMDGGKLKIPNPILTNITNVEALRWLFGRYNLYNLNIEDYVVFSGNHNSTRLFISHATNVISLKKLKMMLKSGRYDQDNDYDVEQLYNIIVKNKEDDD